MSLWIRIDAGAAVLSHDAPHEERSALRTALVEARGALLSWDVVSDERFPDAEVHSPREAAGWLAEVYGDAVAAAVLTGADTAVTLPESPELLDAVHRLGRLLWAADWWPAGIQIPALDAALLAAETAVAAHAVAHLLDDDDATERALAQATAAPSTLAAIAADFPADAAALLDAITAVADDHGIELSPALPGADAAEWALAAGAHAAADEGIELSQGSALVRWADVPAQTVAADSDARWSLRHVGGASQLHVSVAAVPGAKAELWARFGPESVDIDIPLHSNGVLFTGRAPVAASVALLPHDERTLWVRDPLLAPTTDATESDDDRAALLACAQQRLGDPHASLTERAAGA